MEKRQLLLITKNTNLIQKIADEAGPAYEFTSVKSVHAGYSLALNYLPDIIIIDYPSVGLESLKSLKKFKSCHFLNKSFLFLIGDRENRNLLSSSFQDQVDGILFQDSESDLMIQEIEESIQVKRCLTNYWKDSFMGLFNLLGHPVVLLQDNDIIAVNDAFKKDFFITGKNELKLTDLVERRFKSKVKQMLRKFVNGKHMKASSRTMLKMNGKQREANITFSKLDKALSGQLIMMINFAGKENPLVEEIGSSSKETEQYFFTETGTEDQCFTKREQEVISLLCKGYKTKEISEILCISAKTIEKHRANIVKRTRSGTILESIVYALNHNMVEI